jgi:hypothetical protein
MLRVEKLRELILESPACRTVVSTVFPIVAGLLSGSFVLEITAASGELVWANFYRAPSFFGLCVLTIGIYWYNRQLYVYEKEIRRFLDADYCIAYMRSKCLPEAAERYRELIRSGVGGELKQAMDELRKILK